MEEPSQGVEQLLVSLGQSLQTEQDNPSTLCDILSRLADALRNVKVPEGSAEAIVMGNCLEKTIWPVIQQTLLRHPCDREVVAEGCRALRFSIMCAPGQFKTNVIGLAQFLVAACQEQLHPFSQEHLHPFYFDLVEILATTYADDPDIMPTLTHLFHTLSETVLQILNSNSSRLDDMAELVEQLYGMFERYLRYVPMVVLEAPTLPPVLQLCIPAVFVQHKGAIEAIVVFIEAVCALVAECNKQCNIDEQKVQHGQILRPHLIQISGELLNSIFQLIAQVPAKYLQGCLPPMLEGIRNAAGKDQFDGWLEASLGRLPPSIGASEERLKFRRQLVEGDEEQIYDAVEDMCTRCQQIGQNDLNELKETTSASQPEATH